MEQRRTRIWLGVGSAILVGGLGAAGEDAPLVGKALAQGTQGGGHAQMAQAGGGGEGGEGGEGGASQAATTDAQPPEPDVALTTTLLLMKGHLLVGDELAKEGRWSEALPHFLHPAEELYGDVRAALVERDLPPFADALDGLARTVRKGDAGPYPPQRDAALARIDAALASVPAAKRGQPAFLGEVATAVLATAADEYGAAFEGDRIANVVEYQDSRGFVLEVVRLLDANRAAFTGGNAERLAEMRRQLDELAKAWPGVTPPAQPAMRPGEALALVSGVELSASGLR